MERKNFCKKSLNDWSTLMIWVDFFYKVKMIKRCDESNAYLYKKLHESVPLAVSLLKNIYEVIQDKAELSPRFLPQL